MYYVNKEKRQFFSDQTKEATPMLALLLLDPELCDHWIGRPLGLTSTWAGNAIQRSKKMPKHMKDITSTLSEDLGRMFSDTPSVRVPSGPTARLENLTQDTSFDAPIEAFFNGPEARTLLNQPGHQPTQLQIVRP